MKGLYKLAKIFYSFRIKPLARIIEILNFTLNSNSISAQADIGEGTIFFHHGLGCTIHIKAKTGTNC